MTDLLRSLARFSGPWLPVLLALITFVLGSLPGLFLLPFRKSRALDRELPVPSVSLAPAGMARVAPVTANATLRQVAPLLTFILVGVLAWLVMGSAGKRLPAVNDPRFDRRSELSLARSVRDRAGIDQNTLRLTFPSEARIDDDFDVDVAGSLDRVRNAAVAGDSGLVLEGTSDGEVISPQRVVPRGSAPLSFRRHWQITAKKEGERHFTFAYEGSDFTPGSATPGDTTFVDRTVASGPHASLVMEAGRPEATLGPGLLLELPSAGEAGPTVLRFPVLILTTIGVKKSTYDVLHIVLSILSALLAAGVLKLLLKPPAGPAD